MRKTILVVEDSDSSRDITCHFLQQGGYRVLEANDGHSALELLKKRHVDLILTDIMMPNMDGWQFSAEVRKDKRFNMTPFVFLSVLDDLDDQIKGLTMGVDDYLSKPITPPQLLARVNTALTRTDRLKPYFYRDPVTELETEAFFLSRLAQEVERGAKAGRKLSLVVVGIGNYEALVRGHADWFAQQAVEQTGIRLKKHVRSYDLVADMQQGRFAALFPEAGIEGATKWAEKVKGNWDVSVVWPETEQKIGIEIGFTVDALCPDIESAADAEALLNKRLQSFQRKW
ncbi:MAG TPA: response regulator [Mariprofundaceae bacterium]|nr:response regulator [Mariprofundaceae bacterium]